MVTTYITAVVGFVTIALAWIGIELAWRRAFGRRDQDERLSGCKGCLVCTQRCGANDEAAAATALPRARAVEDKAKTE